MVLAGRSKEQARNPILLTHSSNDDTSGDHNRGPPEPLEYDYLPLVSNLRIYKTSTLIFSQDASSTNFEEHPNMPDQTTQTTHTAPTSLITPYDAVTVVSQRSLNAHLKRAFDVTTLLQTASFRPPAEEEDDFSGFDVVFDAPKVELQLATENRIVVLMINVKSSSLKYLSISGRKVAEIDVSVPAFTVALEVNLVSDIVPFTTLPKEIQSSFASSEELEIRKTYIDFKAASLARLRKSQSSLFSVVDDLSQTALIVGYMDEYLKLLGEKQDEFVFHYIATVLSADNAKEYYPLPSIVPTGVSGIQNLPANNATANTSLGDDTLLAYLHMSEGSILPRAQLSTSSKSLIDFEKTADTPVAILSQAKFLNSSILAKLTEINKRSTWIVDTASVTSTLVPASVSYSLTGHLGWDVASDKLAWVPVHSSLVSKDALSKVEGPGSWYHFKNNNHKEATAKIILKVTQKATTENWIFVPEGLTNDKVEISLFGSTLVDFYAKLDINGSSGYVKSEWATKIIFDSSRVGQSVVVSTEDTIVPTITNKVTEEATLHAGELAADIIKPAVEELKRFTFNLVDLGLHLKNALQRDWPFFIPTQGNSLYVDKVFFNKGVDLVCELQQR